MEFKIGNEAVASYRRLDYTPWHALAEFIDNSTQSYLNHKSELDKVFSASKDCLKVRIIYDSRSETLRITDNSIGMGEEDLERALTVGKPPKDPEGRSRYGMGLKTAACWFGDHWAIETKRLGETSAHRVDLDVEQIIKGNKSGVKYRKLGKFAKDQHFTIIEIQKLHRSLRTKTITKIKTFLGSMYREDLRSNKLELLWGDDPLIAPDYDSRIYTDSTGKKWKTDFEFSVNKKKVWGWVGILHKGSRASAGFSIMHCGRVIKGWPDSWRPTSLYGQDLGTNDLINQRLVGEIHFDNFDVTHTKDNILWQSDEEDEVLEKLRDKCADYREKSRDIRVRGEKGPEDERGPSEKSISMAAEEFKAELTSSEMIDALNIGPILPEKVMKAAKDTIFAAIEANAPILEGRIGDVVVKVYLEELDPMAPYLLVDASQDLEVEVAVNRRHPHFSEYLTDAEIRNYLRHCVYDALAEWKARKKVSRIDPDTIKMIKDTFLRVPLLMEQHLQDGQSSEESHE